MTENKVFEIRDRATFIIALVTRIKYDMSHSRPDRLIHRSGYGTTPLYLYQPLSGMGRDMVTIHPEEWDVREIGRTHGLAHRYIIDNWDSLEDGAVVDVRVMTGERKEPAETDLL